MCTRTHAPTPPSLASYRKIKDNLEGKNKLSCCCAGFDRVKCAVLISHTCSARSDKWVSFYCLLVVDKVLGLILVAHNASQAQDVFLTTACSAFHKTVVFSMKGRHRETKTLAKSVFPSL